MLKKLTINLEPFSINSMYCKNRSWKTQKYNEWSANVFHQLNSEENLKAFEELRNYFDPEKHAYEVNLRFFYPDDKLFTKKGSLSSRAHDISNIEKPLIDLLFLPVYYKKPSPYGCKNLNIDDKFIKSMSSQKMSADESRIDVTIHIYPT